MNLENEIDKIANFWLQKEKEGLSTKEKDELFLWLGNKNHEKSYNQNKKLIEEILNLDDEFIVKMEEEVEEKESFSRRSKYLVASIAVACILVFSVYEVNMFYSATYHKEYLSLNEKVLHIVLPDKSIIDLDIKSKLKIKYFKNKREVILEKGKAIFHVAKNKERPFFVKSGNTIVEVVGTTFEVIHLKDKSQINVIEGLVKVNHIYNAKGDSKTLVRLRESETLGVNEEGKVLTHGNVDIKKIASWKNDMIIFNKMTLLDASSIFERYCNKKMSFESYELSQLKISGKFSTLHYDSFLEAIELIYPIKYNRNGNLIQITKK